MGLIKKVKEKLQKVKDSKEQQDKLIKWKGKLENALSKHNDFRAKCGQWDSVYNGTKGVISLDGNATQDARQVINITMQLIEAQITTEVPQPRVDALESDDQGKKEMIEGMLTYMASGTDLQRLTTLNERICKKNSYAVFKIGYNPDYQSHTFRGKVEITNPHPCNVIPQPGVYKVEDMDYIFHIENRTIDYVCRRYGEDFREDLESDNAEYNYLENMSGGTNSNDTEGIVSVVECWHKDKEGDICLITWANDVMLRDEPKFYYRRDESGKTIDTETITIEDGTAVDVKCQVPKRFPFVIWYNIPKEKSFVGKSDVEIISDQQEGIKKLLSMEEEKQIKGTSKIFTRTGSGLKDKITNATSQILETDEPTTDVIVKDMKTSDVGLKDLFNIYKENAKEVLGVTDAWQGKVDGANLSGKAIQALSQNSQGRMGVKETEKNMAFAELYQLIYDFLIAFYDDVIPYKLQGSNTNPKFGYFDKSKLLKQDKAGEYYFPEFDIYINVDAGISRDKASVMQNTISLFQQHAMDINELWTILDNIGFPYASEVLEMEKQKVQQAQEQARKQAELQQQQMKNQQTEQQNSPQDTQQDTDMKSIVNKLPQEDQQAFMQMSPEEQQAIVQKLMGGNQQ